MRISDWSSDVCSSDLGAEGELANAPSEPAISCTYADLKYPVYTIRVTRYQPGDKGERPPSRRRIRDTSRIIRCPPDSAGGWTQPCLRHFASQYHRGTVHPSPSEVLQIGRATF